MLLTIGQKPESDFTQPVGMLRDCHKRITWFLAALARAAEVFRGLPLPSDQQDAIVNSLRYFREAAPKHTADEEQSLFPRLLTSIPADAGSANVMVQSLESEHRWAERQHDVVDALFRNWMSNACLRADDGERLRSTLSKLQRFYADHIRAEESTLFPLAEERIPKEELLRIGAEMAARRGVRFASIE